MDEMSPEELLRQIAVETIGQLDDALGDDFEAVVIVFPSTKLIEDTEGQLPCSMHSTADERHTRLVITSLYEEESRIILPGSVH